jgi:hypothetical protein
VYKYNKNRGDIMNEKIDWMLGMSENMMNAAVKNMDKPEMKEMYTMTSTMMGNLNHMKMYDNMDHNSLSMMEQMMRNMETMMTSMDMNNDMHKKMMKNMMGYMVMMQMNMLMNMMNK